MLRLNTRGQSLSEVAIYLAVVVGAILAMQLYIQRSLQAKSKAGADYLFTQIESNAADKGISGFSGISRQYDPYYRESNITETNTGVSTVGFPEVSINQTVSRSGQEKTGPASEAD